MCKVCCKRVVAEFLGTFVLVLFGCGSAIIAGEYISNVGISMTFGLTLLFLVYAIGPISGCHVNPAVSIGMLAIRRMSLAECIRYVVAQCFGAILASLTLYMLVRGIHGFIETKGLGQNYYGGFSKIQIGTTGAFMLEMIMTAIFVYVICSVTAEKNKGAFTGLAIGSALLVIHLILIPVTGTSVNPARSLGPALFAGGTAIHQLWLFLIAPVVGGLIGAIVFKFLDTSNDVCKVTGK